MTQVGRGEHFRGASWIERGVERLRGGRTRTAPPALRRLHEFVLDLLPGDHLVDHRVEAVGLRLVTGTRLGGFDLVVVSLLANAP